MILDATLIPTTETSHPFCSAVYRCDIGNCSYVEEEYLFRGSSNIYSEESGSIHVSESGCKYSNRMIIRRPAGNLHASGKVIVEIINSTADFDIERIWAESSGYLMRHGHVYVGITSKPNVFPAFKKFDEDRYIDLNWENPHPERRKADKDGYGLSIGAKDQEMGLIWDMLIDLPLFLRGKDKANPLQDIEAKSFFLAGWSQSSGYISCFIKNFVNQFQKCRNLYNGYLCAGGIHTVVVPLNSIDAETMHGKDSITRIDHIHVPYIELNTESENSDDYEGMGYTARRDDSDRPGFLYRYMEIAGGLKYMSTGEIRRTLLARALISKKKLLILN